MEWKTLNDIGTSDIEERSPAQSWIVRKSRKAATSCLLYGAIHDPLVLPLSSRQAQNLPYTNAESEEDQCRESIAYLVSLLREVEDADLDYGIRSSLVGAVADSALSKYGEEWYDGMGRLASSINSGVHVEALAEMIRHTSAQVDDYAGWKLMRPLVMLMDDPSDEKALAATRTIGDVGDRGVVPALQRSLKAASNDRRRKEIAAAISNIERADAARARA